MAGPSRQPHPIGRYATATGIEAEYEPGSRRRVLRNLPGIRSPRQMDQAEYTALVAAQQAYLGKITADTAFSVDLICRMHQDWLSSLYAWAGRFRTVELSKAGFQWPPAHLVAANMQTIERETLRHLTPCRPAPHDAVALALAQVQADLLFVHPFREGNGRLARWLCDLMAMQAGLPPVDYGFVERGATQRRDRYLLAVRAGYRRDYAPLGDFLREGIDRALTRARRRR
jgi:cell filamentation protein